MTTEEIKALLDGAAPGPWGVTGSSLTPGIGVNPSSVTSYGWMAARGD